MICLSTSQNGDTVEQRAFAILLSFFYVKPMQDAMYEGAGQHGRDRDEEQSRKESVEGGEQLRARVPQRIDGSHAAEDHRRIQQCIQPGKVRKVVVTENSHAEGDRTDTRNLS